MNRYNIKVWISIGLQKVLNIPSWWECMMENRSCVVQRQKLRCHPTFSPLAFPSCSPYKEPSCWWIRGGWALCQLFSLFIIHLLQKLPLPPVAHQTGKAQGRTFDPFFFFFSSTKSSSNSFWTRWELRIRESWLYFCPAFFLPESKVN